MRKALLCLALCLAFLAGCARQEPRTATVYAMDTIMDLTAYGPKAQEALEAAEAEIRRLDALLSTGRPDSDISKINAAGDRAPVSVSAETAELVQCALGLCEATGGALDITVYPAMEAWGFPSGEYRVPSEEERRELQRTIGYEKVEVLDVDGTAMVCAPSVELDLGAVGKGHTGDRIMTLWRQMGVTCGIISLGGNVQCLGTKPDGTDWTVGIRDPENENELLATVTGRDMAVVTSGAYQRNFIQNGVFYHHILDPKTCAPAQSGITSMTVVGESGFVSDALSTALYVMGPDAATEYWRANRHFGMIYYTEEGTLWYTAGLKDRLALREGLKGQMLT